MEKGFVCCKGEGRVRRLIMRACVSCHHATLLRQVQGTGNVDAVEYRYGEP